MPLNVLEEYINSSKHENFIETYYDTLLVKDDSVYLEVELKNFIPKLISSIFKFKVKIADIEYLDCGYKKLITDKQSYIYDLEYNIKYTLKTKTEVDYRSIGYKFENGEKLNFEEINQIVAYIMICNNYESYINN